MRLVFFGTPAFAVPPLEKLLEAGHSIAAVYTQPDRPKGRGREVAASPVKVAAQRLGLPVRQPERIRNLETAEELGALGASAMVVVGYGKIIPQSIIDLAPRGIINVHASLLPKYRGAAPVQWAIANGETVTGVTTMLIDSGMDTGDILMQRETLIGAEETAGELGQRLSLMGADLLIETFRRLEAGTLVPSKQDNEQATYAPALSKQDGRIDWNRPARWVYNRVRGFSPWPGAWTTLRGHMLHVWRARVDEGCHGGQPGAVRVSRRRLLVSCGESTCLEILELQLEGRKIVTAEAFLNGRHLEENEILGEVEN